MCLEFIFAFLYFFILLFINFFLIKIITDSFKKNYRLKKFQNSLKISGSSASFFIPFLYFYLEKRLNYQKKEILLSSKKVSEDILLLGNFYKCLQERQNIEDSFFYYINLQETQYLAKKKEEM